MPFRRGGFTLIELLVVISILAVLGTIGVSSFKGAQAKARDSQRKNDLNAIASALEIFFQAKGSYLTTASNPNSCIIDPDPYSQQNFKQYLGSKTIPVDPSTKVKYCYVSDSKGSFYKIWAKLENSSDSQTNIKCSGQYNYNYTKFSEDQTSSCAPGDVPIPNYNITSQIASGLDDVNEDGATYSTYATSVWLGNRSTGAAWTGFRFTNVTIPQGAHVYTAKLEVTSTSTPTINMDFIMAAENTANSAAFSNTSRPSSRILTSQTVAHHSNNQWTTNTAYQLDEMAPIVQAIVNRPDWSSGNSLSVILHGNGSAYGYKTVYSFEGSPANAVKLLVTYTN